jgi:hypothetical protein
MKIHLVGAKLFHMKGQTDMMKLTVAFRNFADMPNFAALTTSHMLCKKEHHCEIRNNSMQTFTIKYL